ncbi:MAG: hypothetical protein KKE11_03660 [Gammaproteobacteria bacterium]|nr:hypothetical protein [Gammaproteobacteria bacterium]
MNLRNFFVVFVMLSLSALVFAGNNSKFVATKVSVFKPMIAPTKIKRGFCWMNSIAVERSDAWRCMVGNNIFDPCFYIGVPDMLICGVDPEQNESGFLLRLVELLPQLPESKPSSAKDRAWLIKLENGQICRPYTGSMPVIKHSGQVMALQYGCDGGENGEATGLLSDSIVPGKIWRAKKIIYIVGPTGDPTPKNIKIHRVAIKEVWR